MVTEITLALAALYLALFCLRCCVRLRRELYFPLPKGLSALVKSRRAGFIAMLGAHALSAAAAFAEGLARRLGAGPGILRPLGAAYAVFQAALLLAAALYAALVLSPKRRARATARRCCCSRWGRPPAWRCS